MSFLNWITSDQDSFGKGMVRKRNIDWLNGMLCFRPKDEGGLGIHDLCIKNSALLGKWLFKLLTEDGIWQRLLRRKYTGSKAVIQVVWKPGDSHFWAGLMATKKHFFRFGVFNIKDGTKIRFWEDKWLGDTTLQEQYPALYNIVRHKGDTIATVMQSSPPNVRSDEIYLYQD